jgi:putative oxidoreductase
MAGLVYAQHGMQKHFGWFGGHMGKAGTVELFSQSGLGGILELGGFLIALGLFTRPLAFLAAGEMAVAYFLFHSPRGFAPIVNRGEVPVLLCFIFLYLAAAGGGRYSIDGLVRGRRAARASAPARATPPR